MMPLSILSTAKYIKYLMGLVLVLFYEFVNLLSFFKTDTRFFRMFCQNEKKCYVRQRSSV